MTRNKALKQLSRADPKTWKTHQRKRTAVKILEYGRGWIRGQREDPESWKNENPAISSGNLIHSINLKTYTYLFVVTENRTYIIKLKIFLLPYLDSGLLFKVSNTLVAMRFACCNNNWCIQSKYAIFSVQILGIKDIESSIGAKINWHAVTSFLIQV